MATIGIVTVTYNSSAVIQQFLQSLSLQKCNDWTLYLVDSGSSDDTLAQVAKFSDLPICNLAQTENVGFARGCNIGIRTALQDGCTSVLLINNDVEFEDDFLELLFTQTQLYLADVYAPKMLYFQPNDKIWAAGGGFKPQWAWAAFQRGENERDIGQYDENYYCDFVPMCCVLIRAEVFEKIGLLDEKYFIYSEDADWFYRAKHKGIKLLYVPQVRLYHKVSSLTGGTTSKIGASFGTRNRVYFICKHFHGYKKFEYLLKYAVGMLVSVLNGKYSWQEFKWRVPAFWQGLNL